jgi:catechol 2,3-dioxygenase-like lactoylglutathione lyase family enzyme
MGRVIDHVDIRVRDRDASQRFYDTVLTVLGRERTVDHTHIDWGDFSIAADGQPVAKHLHIAFYAPSHALVDAFHRAGVEAGYTDDGAPGPRPQYREDYYGGFLRDPDGNSVEAVYTGQQRKTGAIDHVWLRTRDVAAIRRFYVATGQEIGVDEPDHVQIVTANGSISYVAGEPLTEHVHLAFGVDTNEAVDAFHRAAIDAGYTDNGAPGERAIYHPGYYGAFVLDPDGHNIEAVNHNLSARNEGRAAVSDV